jgi:hypothetical protein
MQGQMTNENGVHGEENFLKRFEDQIMGFHVEL